MRPRISKAAMTISPNQQERRVVWLFHHRARFEKRWSWFLPQPPHRERGVADGMRQKNASLQTSKKGGDCSLLTFRLETLPRSSRIVVIGKVMALNL